MLQISYLFLCFKKGDTHRVGSVTNSVRARAYYAQLFFRAREAAQLNPILEVEFTDARIRAGAADILAEVDQRFCEEVRFIAAFLDCCWFDRPPSESELRQLMSELRGAVHLLRQKLTAVRPLIEPQLGELVERPTAFEHPTKIWDLDEPIYPLLRALKGVESRLKRRLDEPTGGAPALPKQAAIWALRDLIIEYKGSCSQRDLLALAQVFLEPVLTQLGDFADIRYHVREVIKIADRDGGNSPP